MILEYTKTGYFHGQPVEETVEYEPSDEEIIRFLVERIMPGADEEAIRRAENILWEANDLGALNLKNIEEKYAEELWSYFAEKIQGE